MVGCSPSPARGTMDDSQWKSSDSPLLKLPAELRDVIYELVVVSHTNNIQPALARACRQTRSEVLRMFYSNHCFFFKGRPSQPRRLIKALEPRHADLIRKISFDVDFALSFDRLAGGIEDKPRKVTLSLTRRDGDVRRAWHGEFWCSDSDFEVDPIDIENAWNELSSIKHCDILRVVRAMPPDEVDLILKRSVQAKCRDAWQAKRRRLRTLLEGSAG